MPSERDSTTLREMLRHIELAEKFALGQSYESLRSDLMPLFAVIRCLEVISEASRRLSDELKARHPQIPWRQIADAGISIVISTRTCCRSAYGKPYNKICRSCARLLNES
jgi:uncharacterized protein with HEPN domain